ncbi:CHAT domain-containing protein [Flammeovirga sp. MY04]|uniref:CHAT domain-containing protein n=1 Tax=Flammeovirga sp. MY04 TaxID=1191459 RepID=UPI00080638FC|nr:CHAT domain-containing protein [Flammeovirga sp. MY04]ANQ49182.1 CHAT domain-containing protein [Flammeovirga sp. MY04]
MHQKLLLFLAFLLSFSLCYSSDNSKESYSAKEIISLSNKGNLNEAKSKAKEWLNYETKIHGPKSIHNTVPLIVLGRICLNRQEYSEATVNFQDALDIFDETTGWMFPDYAISLNYLCTSYLLQGRTIEPKKLMPQIQSILDNTLGEANTNQVHFYANKGLLSLLEEDIETSENYFTQANDLAKKVENNINFDNDFSDLRIYTAKLYNASNRQDEAIRIIEKELEVLADKGWDKSANYARAQMVLAVSFMLDGQYSQSEQLMLEIRNRIEKILGETHFSYAAINKNIALLYYYQSRFDESEKLLEEAVQIYRKDQKEKYNLSECLVGIINLKLKKGEYANIEKLLEEVERLLGDNAKENLYLQTTKARWQIIKGEFVKAEILLTSQLDRLRYSHKMYTRNFVESYLDLIELQIYVGRTKSPEMLLKQGEKLLREAGQDSTLNYAEILSVSAFLDEYEGQYHAALKKLEQSEKLLMSFCGKDHLGIGMINEQKGRNYYYLNQLDSATYCINQALELYDDKLKKTEVHFIHARIYKALIYLKREQYTSAIKEFEQLSHLTFDGTILNTRVRADWAYTLALSKEWEKAEQLIIEAVKDRFEFYDLTMRYSSSQEKMKYLNSTNRLFDRFFDIFDLMGDEVSPEMLMYCYTIQIRFRDYFLVETRDRLDHMYEYREERLNQGFPSYTSKLLKGRDQIATVNFLSNQQRDSLKVNINKLQSKINNLEKTLVLASNKYLGKQQYNRDLSFESVRQKLGNNEVAIEIIKLRTSKTHSNKYIALLVSKEIDHPLKVDLGESNFLEGKVFYNYQRKNTPLGRGLEFIDEEKNDDPYDNYWLPIKKTIASLNINAERIYLVTDGIYNLINVNTLKNLKTNRYVLEEDYIRQLTSTTTSFDLIINRNKKHKTAYLVGNPIFDERLLEESKTRGSISKGLNVRLAELPGTGKEISNSHQLLLKGGWDVEVFTREKAKEGIFKNMEKSPDIIHIATHGFFINNFKNSINENTLLKSGLFFSDYTNSDSRSLQEIYESGNDGILTAYEVAGLNLQNTELLILSACQSGVSEVKEGQGISGLQYAFSIAGVKSVVMSLWNVDDQATQELMTKFYEYWSDNNDRHQAFRKAQLDILKKYERPYYWGAFVMIN